MKINDIKKAFDSVSANGELKEKVFSRLETELSEETEIIPLKGTSRTEVRKGGGKRFTAAALCTAAAVIATVFVMSRVVFNVDVIDEPDEVTETTYNAAEIPEGMALVKLRVVDENGEPVKNMRIDYLPVIVTEKTEQNHLGYIFDVDNFDKGKTLPITYGRDEKLLIPYGDYCFNASDALPNVEYDMFYIEQFNMISFTDETGSTSQFVTIDESTEEIVLTIWGGNNPYEYNYPKLGIILQDSQGNPLSDYTVILKPKDGVMQEGYTDKYGGYVLTRTNEHGEAFWRGTPVEGEYEVIAYKEELHPADEPIREPFVFGDDNTFIYKQNDMLSVYQKTFTAARGAL